MYYTTDGFGYVNYVVPMIMICLCVKSLDHEVSFIGQEKNIPLVVHCTPSVPNYTNYRSFDFFHLNFGDIQGMRVARVVIAGSQ